MGRESISPETFLSFYLFIQEKETYRAEVQIYRKVEGRTTT